MQEIVDIILNIERGTADRRLSLASLKTDTRISLCESDDGGYFLYLL